MLGIPEAGIAQLIAQLGQSDGFGHGLRRSGAFGDGGEVLHGEGESGWSCAGVPDGEISVLPGSIGKLR